MSLALNEAQEGRLEILLSPWFSARITPRNCLKFMFTPNLLNHAGCKIALSRNNAFFHPVFTL